MKKAVLFIIFLLSILSGCSDKLPENYGVYLKGSDQFVRMDSQRVLSIGNLFQAISGLRGFMGVQCQDVKYFIVYQKDLNPNQVRLASLQFQENAPVQNMFGPPTRVKTNLWLPAKDFGLDISPMEKKKDMYKLTPREKLLDGFYAVYFGAGLGNAATLDVAMGNSVYDFVIGSKDKYLSKEEAMIDKKLDKQYKKLVLAYAYAINYGDIEAIKQTMRTKDGELLNDAQIKTLHDGVLQMHKGFGDIIGITFDKTEDYPNQKDKKILKLKVRFTENKEALVDTHLPILFKDNNYYGIID